MSMMDKSLKIIQINKGDSILFNCTDQLQDIIVQYKPNILIINELNSPSGDTMNRNQFVNYRMETDNLDISDQMSRTGILVHRDIHYKRTRDLENVGTSTIWLQLTYPGRKPVLLQALYCQFQRLGKAGSKIPASQQLRWSKVIEKWEAANEEGFEVITMGDTNLIFFRWDLNLGLMNSYNWIKKMMIDKLKSKILEEGTILLNKTSTRTRDTPGSKDSCLDMIFTN